MKKVLYIILFLIISVSGYAQNQQGIEALRYYDTVKERYVTVNVEPNGWFEEYRTVSDEGTQNAKLLMYSTFKPSQYSQTEWGLAGTMPIPYETKGILTTMYSEWNKNWKREPLQGFEFKIRDFTYIQPKICYKSIPT
jgi:hypothetical protein